MKEGGEEKEKGDGENRNIGGKGEDVMRAKKEEEKEENRRGWPNIQKAEERKERTRRGRRQQKGWKGKIEKWRRRRYKG